MSDTAVTSDPINPSQSGAPVPNDQRAPIEGNPAAVDPAAKPVEAPNADPAPADGTDPTPTPKIGDEDVADPNKLEAPTSADADENGVITYPETGDVGMDMALEFVGKLGIGMDHPAMQATLKNDFGPIEAVLHQMGDKAKGYERFLTLAKAANDKALEASKARADAIGTAVTSVLGDSQKAILTWASKTATPEEKKSINAMLAADPVQARAAATILLNAYSKASGNVIEPASATTLATGGDPAQSNNRLTPKEYARELDAIARKYGSHNVHRTTEYVALSRRLG